jgi:thiamine-monophosphate kinase
MPRENKKRTELSLLGEFGLIKHLTDHIILKNRGSVKGVGDDAALINLKGRLAVVSTDLLVEGIHFNLEYTPLKHLGYKSVIVNISDIYAMNAVPKQITVSIAVSAKFSLEDIDALYSGIYLACDNYGIDLVGGDTSPSLTGMTISVTAIGEVDESEAVFRSTAKVNDLICVSGDLGAAYMGLQLLEREKKIFRINKNVQPVLRGKEYILQRQLKPEARKDIIQCFKDKNFKPTSMIDISDGLSSDILHLCTDSGVGCRLMEEKIPIAEPTRLMAEEFNIEPSICALSGGEDYELLFTVSLNNHEIINTMTDVSIIGFITPQAEGVNLVTSDNQLVPVTAQGWDALMSSSDL